MGCQITEILQMFAQPGYGYLQHRHLVYGAGIGQMDILPGDNLLCIDAIPGDQNIARNLVAVRRFTKNLYSSPANHIEIRDGVAVQEQEFTALALGDAAVADQQFPFFPGQAGKKRQGLERFYGKGHLWPW